MQTCIRCGATMTAQSTNRFVCEFCGNTVLMEPEAPIVEHTPKQQPVREREIIDVQPEEKSGSGIWGFAVVFFAILLIILIIISA